MNQLMLRSLTLGVTALLSSSILLAQKLPGTADSTFHTNGYGVYSFGDKSAQAVKGVIDKNGQLIVMGGSLNAQFKWDVGLSRYQMNGSEDMSFRMNAGPSHIDFNNLNSDFVHAIAKTQNGDIIAAGGFTGPNGADLMVAKFNQDGIVQINFGLNGVFKMEVDPGYEVATDILEDKDGKIVILGNIPATQKKMFVLRLNPNGVLDSTFDKDGILLLNPQNLNNLPVALLERPEGGYYVICNTTGNGESLVTIHSVSKNGNTNIDLGGTGEVSLKIDGKGTTATDAYYFNRSIFICGTYNGPQNNADGFLARLELDGTWNSAFAGTGFARILHDLSNPYDELTSDLCIAPDSSIFLATVSATTDTATLIISRYKSDGNVEGLYGNSNGKHQIRSIEGFVLDFSIDDVVLDTGSRRLYLLGNQSNPVSNGFFIYATYTGGFKEGNNGGGTGLNSPSGQINVFPNPANNHLHIDGLKSESVNVKIYNLQGSLVLTVNSLDMEVNSLQNGIYILRAQEGNILHTTKFLIQH
ncbi:MAG: T9SS type A sorting domain-containing protein [Bacteroidetes bacterium]|nr:T9SS type A sorting domain-containing protein [Bacteroidota bacterium]